MGMHQRSKDFDRRSIGNAEREIREADCTRNRGRSGNVNAVSQIRCVEDTRRV